MMTPIWLGTSWKMNKPLSQAMARCETLAARMPEGCHPAIQPFVIPPSPRSNLSAIFCKRISYRF